MIRGLLLTSALLLPLAACGEPDCYDMCEKARECDWPIVASGDCLETCSVPGADEMCQARYDCIDQATCEELITNSKCQDIKCF